MADTFGFDEDGVRRIVRAVRKIEGLARPQSLRDDERPYESIPLLFRHDAAASSDVVPAWGVMAVSGSTTLGDDLLLLTQRPSSVHRELYMVNGEDAVANGAYGTGYITGRLTVLYSTPPTTSFEDFGPTTAGWKLDTSSTFAVAQSLGVVSSSNVAGSSDSARMEALWILPMTTAAADVKMAATSENSGKYANELFTDWNATPQWTSGQDFFVEFEPRGTTPNQSIDAFIDSDAYPGYSSGAEQYMGHDSSGVVGWRNPSSAIDEKLAASSENDGVYWGGLHSHFNATTFFNSTADFRIESEITGTTPNQDIFLYVDNSDISLYDASYHQFCMHNDSSGGLVWRRAAPAISSGVYNSSNDFKVEIDIDSLGDLQFFVDNSDISGYTTAQIQYLGHNASGLVTWSTIASTDIDERVAATSENNGKYWNDLHAGYNASTVFNSTADFKVESEVTGTTPDQQVQLYIDNSDISLYDAAYHQFFMHNASSGGLVCRRTAPAISSGVYNSSNDIKVEVDIDASGDLQFFTDCSDISGYTTASNQILGHTTSGLVRWTTDELVAISSGHSPKYLGVSFTGYSTVATFEVDNDFLVDFEEDGTAILGFVDASLIANYSTVQQQWLTHSTALVLTWTTASPGGGADEKLAATSNNTGVYWNQLHAAHNATTQLSTTQDLLIESEVSGTTPNQTIRLYWDVSDTTLYDSAYTQLFTHNSSGTPVWRRLVDFSESTVFNSTPDIPVKSEVIGGDIKFFTDVSAISGYSTTQEQYLTNSSGITEWTSGIDDRMAATSENNGDYWGGLHNDFNASTVYNSTSDLLIESEVAGTTPDQTLRLYVDVSDISGFVSSNFQVLAHDSSAQTKWINVTTCAT